MERLRGGGSGNCVIVVSNTCGMRWTLKLSCGVELISFDWLFGVSVGIQLLSRGISVVGLGMTWCWTFVWSWTFL